MANESHAYRRRRDFLAATGVAGLTLITGCLGDDDDGGDDSSGDDGSDDDSDDGDSGDDSGVVEGEPIEVSLVTGDPDSHAFRAEYAQMIAANLEEVGFSVTHDAQPIPQMLENVRETRNFDITPYRTGSGLDPESTLSEWFSEGQLEAGGANFAGFEDEEYWAMLEEQRELLDRDERREVIFEMQEYVMDPPIYTPLGVQIRPMPYNATRFENAQPTPEHVLGGQYNFLSMTPIDDRDTLIFSYPEELASINPLVVNRLPTVISSLIYDTLTRYTPQGDQENWAAESINAVDDTTIEITIRDGMEFTDGEPVTADDVAFSYEYANEWGDGPQVAVTDAIEGFDVQDDLTLNMNLSNPYAPLYTRTLPAIKIIPEHIWENVPDDIDGEVPTDWRNEDPVGSGPVELDFWDPGVEVAFTANEDHFSPPVMDNFVLVPHANRSAAISALEAGEVDMVIDGLLPAEAERLDDSEDFEVATQVMESPHMIAPNLRREPWDDPAMQRALAHLVPKDDIIETIFGGYMERMDSPVNPALDDGFWYNSDVPEYEFSTDAAREVLEDAGYEWDDDGNILG